MICPSSPTNSVENTEMESRVAKAMGNIKEYEK